MGAGSRSGKASPKLAGSVGEMDLAQNVDRRVPAPVGFGRQLDDMPVLISTTEERGSREWIRDSRAGDVGRRKDTTVGDPRFVEEQTAPSEPQNGLAARQLPLDRCSCGRGHVGLPTENERAGAVETCDHARRRVITVEGIARVALDPPDAENGRTFRTLAGPRSPPSESSCRTRQAQEP